MWAVGGSSVPLRSLPLSPGMSRGVGGSWCAWVPQASPRKVEATVSTPTVWPERLTRTLYQVPHLLQFSAHAAHVTNSCLCIAKRALTARRRAAPDHEARHLSSIVPNTIERVEKPAVNHC